jgi:hypothetical protein
VSHLSQEAIKLYKSWRNFENKVTYVDYFDSEDEETMVGLVEWVKGKKVVSCSSRKKELIFHITKE